MLEKNEEVSGMPPKSCLRNKTHRDTSLSNLAFNSTSS